MKIAMIGAGAMGCLYGALLAKAGEEVWMVGRRPESIEPIKERGIILTYLDGSQENVAVKATTRSADVGQADLMIFLVMSGDTEAAARESIPMVGPDTYALTLQNGIGNAEKMMDVLGMDRVIYGMTLFGGTLKGPGQVAVEAPAGSRIVVYIGEKKNRPMLFKAAEVLNHAGIRTEVSDDIDQVIWTKLPMACGLGMLTAITRLRVGDLVARDEGKALLRQITDECVEVAEKKGIKLDPEETFNLLVSTGTATGEHISSMLGSILSMRKTEIGSLNEAVANEAEKLGIEAPVNRTVALLVRILENTYDRRVSS
ncbi:ketopantoate reductase family protein [Thermodesulfobacteriota bacterium]